jgi:hypothetical protein
MLPVRITETGKYETATYFNCCSDYFFRGRSKKSKPTFIIVKNLHLYSIKKL